MPDDDEDTIKKETFVWELLSPWINKDNALLKEQLYTHFMHVLQKMERK